MSPPAHARLTITAQAGPASAPAPLANPGREAQLRTALADLLRGPRRASNEPVHGSLTVQVAPQDDGTLAVSWEHHQRGDYNLDGFVNISDLTVLGAFFGLGQDDPVWAQARRADGNGDGLVTINDLSTIALGFDEVTRAYRVELRSGPEAEWELLGQVPLEATSASVERVARLGAGNIPLWQPGGEVRVTALEEDTTQSITGVTSSALLPDLRGDWHRTGRDAQHTSFSRVEGPLTNHVAWELPLPVAGHTSAVVDSMGNLYVGAADGLTSVTAGGSVRWTFPAPQPVQGAPALGPGGMVYFGCNDGLLRAVRLDGSLYRSYAAGGPIRCPVAVGPDNAIYFGCDDGQLYCLNGDLSLRWTRQTPGPVTRPVSFTAAGRVLALDGDLVTPGNAAEAWILDPASGAPLEAEPLGTDLSDTPVVARWGVPLLPHMALVPQELALTVSEFQGVGVARLHKTTADPPLWFIPDFLRTTTSPALAPFDQAWLGVPFSGGMYRLTQFGLTDHAHSFSVTEAFTPAVDAAGTAYCVHASHAESQTVVSAVELDGELLWEYGIAGNILTSQPTLDTGRLYVTTSSGVLALGTQPIAPPDVPTGLLELGSDAQTIVLGWTPAPGASGYEIFRNGQPRATIPAPPLPSSWGSASGRVSWQDTVVESGSTYSYSVRALNRAGASALSASVEVTAPLDSPMGLVATLDQPGRIVLTWATVPYADSYLIYRDQWTTPTEVGAVTTWTDEPVGDWDMHYYYVFARKGTLVSTGFGQTGGQALPGAGATGPGDWAMFDHDLRQTRRAGVLGPAGEPGLQGGSSLPELGTVLTLQDPIAANDGSLYFREAYGNYRGGIATHADGALRYSSAFNFLGHSLLPDGSLLTMSYAAVRALAVLDPQGGLANRSAPASARSGASPTGSGDFIVAEEASVKRFFLDNGGITWVYELASSELRPLAQPPLMLPDGRTWFGTVQAVIGPPPPPGPDDPEAQAADDINPLFALHPDGTLDWTYDQLGDMRDVALAADGTCYIASSADMLRAVASDGTLAWEYPANDPQRICLAGDGAVIYAELGGIVALEADGTLRWQAPISTAQHLLLDSADNLYCVTYNSSAQLYTLRSYDPAGAERWSRDLPGLTLVSSLLLRDDGSLVLATHSGPPAESRVEFYK